jgi:valyl-tRNA synthetase
VLDEILKLLHPFMPFITEELWRVTGERGLKREGLLTLASWPDLNELEFLIGPSEPSFDVVVQSVSEVRAIRTELNIAIRNVTSIELTNFNSANTAVLSSTLSSISRLVSANTKLVDVSGNIVEARAPVRPASDADAAIANLDVTWSPNEAPLAIGAVSDLVVRTPVKEGMLSISVRPFDLDKERARLGKALDQAEADIKRVDAKLANEKFVANAPEEIVEEEKEKRDAAVARKAKILEALERLRNAA